MAVEWTTPLWRTLLKELLRRAPTTGCSPVLVEQALEAARRVAHWVDRGVSLDAAVRAALKRAAWPAPPWSSELEEEMARRPFDVRLKWSDRAIKHSELSGPHGWRRSRGGIYIQLGPAGQLLKVGKAINFHDRLRDYPPSSSFWLAQIDPDPAGILEAVEHAVARTLLRLRQNLPAHDRPRDALTATRGRIIVRDVLPLGLRLQPPPELKLDPPGRSLQLQDAYRYAAPTRRQVYRTGGSGRTVPQDLEPGGGHYPPQPRDLVIKAGMKWER